LILPSTGTDINQLHKSFEIKKTAKYRAEFYDALNDYKKVKKRRASMYGAFHVRLPIYNLYGAETTHADCFKKPKCRIDLICRQLKSQGKDGNRG